MAQASIIRDMLVHRLRGLDVQIVPIKTSGDRMQTASLAQIGGKGLFIRELEQALSDGLIELAVHSMKDLPATLPHEFRLAAVPQREAPNDVLLSRQRSAWEALPSRARLGTSSVRRRLQALRLRPDLEVLPLRGNVDSRMRRLRNGEFDAIILAAAGLKRLGVLNDGLSQHEDRPGDDISFFDLDLTDFVPSSGQGALAVEAMRDALPGGSKEIETALADVTDVLTLAEVTAERACIATIGASCASPVGVNAKVVHGNLMLRALLFSLDGERSLAEESSGEISTDDRDHDRITQRATWLGDQVGRLMLERGAGELIGRE
jgi:hydroxymethylbilane synthase